MNGGLDSGPNLSYSNQQADLYNENMRGMFDLQDGQRRGDTILGAVKQSLGPYKELAAMDAKAIGATPVPGTNTGELLSQTATAAPLPGTQYTPQELQSPHLSPTAQIPGVAPELQGPLMMGSQAQEQAKAQETIFDRLIKGTRFDLSGEPAAPTTPVSAIRYPWGNLEI